MYDIYPLNIVGNQNHKIYQAENNHIPTVQHREKRNENGKDTSHQKANFASLGKPFNFSTHIPVLNIRIL